MGRPRSVKAPARTARAARAPASPAPPTSAYDWMPELRKAKAYEQILLDIIIGVQGPGERLDEQALIRRYNSGLASVRDALGRLALEGLVVRRPRFGTTVAPLDIIEVRQAYEARALIEPQCAALAATHATPEDIDALRRAFHGAEAAVAKRDYRALVAMDQSFHAAIARASRNATLARILIPLQHRAARFWVFSMVENSEETCMDDIDRHQAVTDCIARRDVEGARAAIVEALGDFSDNVIRTVTGGAAREMRHPPGANAAL
jgi:DNA-binding GntR family transcriptional regulator